MKRWLAAVMCGLLMAGTAGAGGIPEGEAEPGAFFKDTVFVGDSILRSVGKYCAARREAGESPLGEARFLAADGYTLYSGSLLKPGSGRINLVYAHRPVSVPEGIRAMGAKRAFVMLGINDGAGSQMEKHLGFYERMIRRILEASPGLDLIALSVTPVVKTAQTKRIRQMNIDLFNDALRALCEKEGIGFLDVSGALKDEEGYLNRDFSSDRQVHLNERGIEALAAVLNEYARERLGLREGAE